MKIDEVHNCENDYYCQQAENEDVADIVASYARASAFGVRHSERTRTPNLAGYGSVMAPVGPSEF